ncbi:hypothetical protein SAMN05444166_1205 [Singulisphaera sp. GP187]|uniref:DUF6157 family protein n=1 Tax=Singulisphaera sp. GP187 TaxID=1882752 RepID=UPI0009281832|nr:DUF6157 family protein [Singulisphaera sp. GP187]SIN83914.1 hypothetical protein SAMN05444166_1205 [Singulisphaera sp. GP187]
MKSMGATDTFIQVASDCAVKCGVIPIAKGEHKSIPVLQYELLSTHPYRYTHDDLLYEVHVRHKSVPAEEQKVRAQAIRAELLAKPHPCLRASLLPKKYGWGIHYDGQGRIALYPMESDAYRRFVQGEGATTLVIALRNKRA